MSKRIVYPWVITLVILSTLLGSLMIETTPADAAGLESNALRPSSAYNTSGQLIDLAFFYKPPSDGNLDHIANNFDTIILTRNDESARDTLRAKGITTPILQYLRFDAIQDPGSCTAQPWRNQVADKPGDFCNITRDNPDWFLRDSNGNRINDGENFYLMDPANAGWRAFWLARARVMQESYGWNGVFLDNVEASLGRFRRMGLTLRNYPDDASFQNAINGFLSYMYNDYFRPNNRPLAANIIWIADPAPWYRYLNNLDGAMDEGWGVDWHTGYLSVTKWEENLERAERTQASGDVVWLISQTDDRNSHSRQQFAFASFLLVSNGRATFRYSDYDLYREGWVYDNYNINLGTPLGPRYKSGSVWKRDFTGGTVTVDPAARTSSISTTPPPTQPAPTPGPSVGVNVKVNFQPSSAAVPAGFVKDDGSTYGNRGNGYTYGWNANNSTNTRDRNAANSPNQAYDTFNHMQNGGTFTWEMSVPNGSYQVRVVAGDANYTDSVYKINVEGKISANGTPTNTNHWIEGTVTVTVSDGRLTVSTASGAVNNKIAFVEVVQLSASATPTPTHVFLPTLTSTAWPTSTATGTATTPPTQGPTATTAPTQGPTATTPPTLPPPSPTPAPSMSVRVNFQPAGASVPTGFVKDDGSPFGDRGNGYTYGWNANNSDGPRDRNAAHSPDQAYDTFNHMQNGGTFTWEIAVPNGTYRVRVVAGDASYTDSVYKINVEGRTAANGNPSNNNHWIEGTVTVTVSDGRLTVSNAPGSKNNKIAFIEIVRVSP